MAARRPDEVARARHIQILAIEARLEVLREKLIARGLVPESAVTVRTDTDGDYLCLVGTRGADTIRVQFSVGSKIIVRCVRGRGTKFYESSPEKIEEIDLDDVASRLLTGT
jgi:hypothetical protein